MTRNRMLSVAAAAILGLAAAAPALATTPGGLASEWHRNNYNTGEEQLFCRESPSSWNCTYRVPDGSGWFSGRNVTASWTCPEWFPAAACDNVTAVYHGRTVYVPDGESPGAAALVTQDYVVTEVDGQAVLQLYWVDRFVCPWYRTYAEALAADFTCTFAP